MSTEPLRVNLFAKRVGATYDEESVIQRLTISQALTLPQVLWVDVRTPLEFLDGAIAGAVNIPLLSNEERVEIGTLYKQKGTWVARERGLELVSPKFPSLYEQVKKVSQGKKPILYCWRGGLRSLTVATILDLVGLEVSVIEGGYKSYRNEVLRVLNGQYPFELITLYGLTGSGKTSLLQKMKKEGLSVIDLEALACHRGSLLGQVGIPTRQNQKNFEALLYDEFRKYQNQKIVFIEGESRRIGPVVLPQSWMDQMQRGRKIFIQSSLEKRTHRILGDYLSQEKWLPEFEEALHSLQKYLGGELFKEVLSLFQNKEYPKMVSLLLERYYDRNYKFSAKAEKEKFILTLENNHDKDEETLIQKLRDIKSSRAELGIL